MCSTAFLVPMTGRFRKTTSNAPVVCPGLSAGCGDGLPQQVRLHGTKSQRPSKQHCSWHVVKVTLVRFSCVARSYCKHLDPAGDYSTDGTAKVCVLTKTTAKPNVLSYMTAHVPVSRLGRQALGEHTVTSYKVISKVQVQEVASRANSP